MRAGRNISVREPSISVDCGISSDSETLLDVLRGCKFGKRPVGLLPPASEKNVNKTKVSKSRLSRANKISTHGQGEKEVEVEEEARKFSHR